MLQSPRIKGIVTFLLIFTTFAINQISGWWILRLWNVRGVIDFQDLNAVLYNADCFKDIGWQIYGMQAGDPCQNYIYGSSLIQILHTLSLGSAQKIAIGWSAIACVSFVLARVTYNMINGPRIVLVLCAMLAISPPILLLVERGNFDWLILVLLYAGSVCFSRNKKFFGYVILSISALLKFYTFPLLIVSIILIKRPRYRALALFSSFLVFLRVFLDLTQLQTIYTGAWFASFGNTTWAKYIVKLNIVLGPLGSTILGLSVTTIIILMIKIIYPRDFFAIKNISRFSANDIFAIFCSITFLGCFFAGQNYDYRLVFLIPSIQFIPKLIDSKAKVLISVSLFLAFIFSYNTKYLQPVGDFAINLLVVIIILGFWQLSIMLWKSKNLALIDQ